MNELNPEIITTREPETSVLQLEKAAVALHVATLLSRPERSAKGATQPDSNCPDFRAMELDLLSYGFQLAPPLISQREFQEPIPVRIRFPERTMYHSEGRPILLPCPTQQRDAEILVSSTLFPESGFRIWHYVFKPKNGTSFTEFDLLKLIHLYDGRIESTGLRDTVLFDLEAGWSVKAATGIRIGELLARLGGAPPGKSWTPQAGTVAILAAGELETVLEPVRKAQPGQGAEASRKLKGWFSKDTPEAAMLKACCGIVTGSFAHTELDAEEVFGILERGFDFPHFIRFHRCTLTSISGESRALEECWDTIGISPYLLIPHAVVLNNEALVKRADDAISSVLGKPSARIGRLEQARAIAEKSLRCDFVPNIFHGPTERSLLARGWESRGTEDRRSRAMLKLEGLCWVIEARWQRRRETGQAVMACLLALILTLHGRQLLFEALSPRMPEPWKWTVLGAIALGISFAIFAFSRLGLRGEKGGKTLQPVAIHPDGRPPC